jgi:hypothetical protein
MRLIVICDWICEYLQLQNQILTILVILTTMMQLLKFSSYWLDQFYIHFQWSIMTFLQKCVPNFPFRHIESILLVPQ